MRCESKAICGSILCLLSTKGVRSIGPRSIGLLMLRVFGSLIAAIDSVQLVALRHSIYR